jgi:hypothetical protein
MKDTVAPQDQTDHELGLEIISVLGLKRKRDNGRINTSHGGKNPCGLTRTLRYLSASPLEKAAPDMLEALQEIAQLTHTYSEGSLSFGVVQSKARAAIAKATQA